VDMGLDDGRDFQPLVLGDFLIAVDIPLGIDDDGFTGSLAADEVGVLSQGGVGDLFEKHDSGFLNLLIGTARGALIPGHAGDEHSHAAPIRCSGENQTRTHKSRKPDERRIDNL
jgi:hypothetical protein